MMRAVCLCLIILASPLAAQGAKEPSATKSSASPGKSTLSGIYTRDEADAGKELFASACSNCHPIATHSTPEFRKKWAGRPLSELFTYMRTLMPKNEPGSLADEDYGVLLAYLLQANKMPAGRNYLSTDTLELRKIRIDTARTVGKP
jgi:mono/diheme cytochrome c family protein